jgi:prolipoprotein diacylglyceryltransferase
MLDFTPDPIAIQLGPLPVYWYGIGYALGLAAAYLVMVRLARRAGENADILGNGMIIVAIAALIGGRLYHVIDQWALYKDDLLKIIAMMGAFLGWQLTFLTIFVGSLLGSLIGVLLILLRGGTMKMQIPFGVFLGPAAIVALFAGRQFIEWYVAMYR